MLYEVIFKVLNLAKVPLITYCYSSLPRGEQFLVRWAVPQLHDIDALSKMVDPSLNGEYPKKSLSRFADIISSCIQVIFFMYHGTLHKCNL